MRCGHVLKVFNISSLAAVTRTTYLKADEFDAKNAGVGLARSIFVDSAKNKAYVGDFNKGIYVLDISTVTAPSLTATYLVSATGQYIAVSADFSKAAIMRSGYSEGNVLINLNQ